jgi:prophage regulatory protein
MFIRMKKLTLRLSLSESTIRRMMDDGSFPYSISLSKGTVGWRIKDVEKWENSRY